MLIVGWKSVEAGSTDLEKLQMELRKCLEDMTVEKECF